MIERVRGKKENRIFLQKTSLGWKSLLRLHGQGFETFLNNDLLGKGQVQRCVDLDGELLWNLDVRELFTPLKDSTFDLKDCCANEV